MNLMLHILLVLLTLSAITAFDNRPRVPLRLAICAPTLRLRGGSAADSTTGLVSGGSGGWKGAQSYLATTGINITATAGSIAAYRSAVTLCNSTYLDDPFAALFARESCPERFKEILSLPAPKLVRFAVRTKFFDNFIRDCVHRRGIKQVVMIGAGFDARVLRGKDMRWDTLLPPTARDLMESNTLTFYELDLPELMDRKRDLLERSGMGPRAAKALGACMIFDYVRSIQTKRHANHGMPVAIVHWPSRASTKKEITTLCICFFCLRAHTLHACVRDFMQTRINHLEGINYSICSCSEFMFRLNGVDNTLCTALFKQTHVHKVTQTYTSTHAHTRTHRPASRAPNRGRCHDRGLGLTYQTIRLPPRSPNSLAP